MTNEELHEIVKTLAASVVAHDNQIEAHTEQIGNLLKVAQLDHAKIVEHHTMLDRLTQQIANLTEQVAATERQWQAYINTLPRQ